MPPPDRPVRLTFPSNDIGWARIMAGDVQVGYVQRAGRGWRASLWSEAGNRDGGRADAPVTGKRLEDLRACLRERVRTGGPWWAAGHPDGTERGGLCEAPGDEERSDEGERP